MYQFAYTEVPEHFNSAINCLNKHHALEKSIELLEAVQGYDLQSQEIFETLCFVRSLWLSLLNDWAHPGCSLPPELRAHLIALGFMVIAAADKIKSGNSIPFGDLIKISKFMEEALIVVE